MISALPFTVEEAGTVVYGAKQGFLHEALALMAITSARPQPIVTAFGADESNTFNLSRYFPEVDVKDPKSVVIAHLAAYIFWYIHWNRIRRHEMKEHFKNCTRQSGDVAPSLFFGEYSLSHNDKFSYNVGSWTPELDIAHSDWCREHFINPSAVKSMSQNIEVTLKTLYRSDFDPEWLKCQALEPAWNKDSTVEKRQHVFSSVYGHDFGRDLSMRTLVELQGQQTLSKGNNPVKASYACIHYLNGYCLFGDDCLNAHSPSAPRPPCRFQLRAGGCTNRNCVYSHNEERADTSSDAAHIKPMHGKFNGGALAWFCQDASSILLLGSCGIIRSLEALGKPPGIVLGGRSILELAHFHQNRYLVNLNRSITKCAWNFPVASSSATDEENETLLRGFFHSAAAFFQSMLQTDAHVEVGLTLEGSQFSKWNVMSVIQHAGFCLEWYEDFDSAIFPSYVPRYANNEPIDTLDAKFFVFRMKKAVLHDHPPRRMEIRHHTQFGMELEMSVSGHLSRDTIAKALSHDGIVFENVDSNWSDVKRTSQNWKLVDDGSLICNPSQPNCNKFELVSPVLQSEAGLRIVSKVLQRLSNVGVTVNRSMGFHVHFDVGKYSIYDVIKICQLFVKYEKAMDSMLPFSRRTGSANSDKFFNSNMKLAMEVLGKNEEGVLAALGSCKNYHDIAEVMNPSKSTLQDRRYFKLNLQNLITERQCTIEFRQHSATADYDKVDAWVRFIIRFCVNAASLDKPTSFDDAPRNVDEQFEHLFKNIIRDSVLHSHYRERRHLLSVNGEGDACCPGCVTGRGCLK